MTWATNWVHWCQVDGVALEQTKKKRKSRATGKEPISKISYPCRHGNCSQCPMESCQHECHRNGTDGSAS